VLAPVDLTPSSDRLLDRIALLPIAQDARLTLLHVLPGSLSPRDQQRVRRGAAKALAEEVRHLRKSPHIRVQTLIRVGAVAREVAKCANAVKAELIVMGRGSGRVLRDRFLGSTAERVVRQARLPVLLVRIRPRAAYSRPALAIDFDGTAHAVILSMLRLVQPPRPRAVIIHAFTDPYDGLRYSNLSEDEAEQRLAERRRSVSQALARLLATSLAQAKARPQDAPVWMTHIRHGSPRGIIRKIVENAEPDLLALGTRSSSVVARAFLGTVAGDLLRSVACDVLVVPPGVRRR
jgi:nucleotide-binding universal stress UspA family protein